MQERFTQAANLLAEPTRATMLLKLLNGKSLPAGELAAAANVSPQTASEHLAKLTKAHLLEVESQGRHRYYRLAGTDVADALEAILVLVPEPRNPQEAPTAPAVGTLAHARTCYSHLAGWLAVRITDSLQTNGFLSLVPQRTFGVTPSGRDWFLDIGVPVNEGRNFARQCLDWTERRPHLAGTLGVAMYRRFVELKWLVPGPRDRLVRLTIRGQEEFWNRLRLAV